MLVVQNLAKKNYLSKFKMAAMPIYGKKHSNDFFSRTTVPIRLIFCMKHIPAKFHDFSVMLTNLKDSHDLTIVF